MSERGGGAATASGMNFQSLAAAWYAVGILAEDQMPPPLGLPAGTRLEWLMCETGEPVDDLLVGTSSGGFIFAQAKNSISLGESPKSDFASVVDQFVRQFLANRDATANTRSWNRPLDPFLDRLVLLAGHDSPSSIRAGLPAVLEKVRSLAGRPLSSAPTNAEEERALRVLRAHLSSTWQAAAAQPPNITDELTILSLIRVQTLDLRQDGSAERESRALLRGAVLEDPSSDAAAWDIVARHCSDLAVRRASADRYLLLQALVEKGIATRVPHSFRSDIEKLQAYTATSLVFLSDLSKIDAGVIQVKIRRECTQPLLDAGLRGSLLVVGDPGAGKSGSLHDLAEEAGKQADCIVLLVDRLNARTIGELRDDIGLENDFVEVLKQWTSTRPGLLVIDALDAAREERAAQTIRDLIRLVVPLGKRWRVVASIRKFDLRYGEGFKKLFTGAPPCPPFVDREFSSVQHINIPKLSDDELTQIGEQAPLLAELLSSAPGELRDLVRVPFNIRLVAELLADGVSSSELTPVRTQLELLESYWSHRVIGEDSAAGDERETVLRAACEQMVGTRSLHIGRAALAAYSPEVLKALLSAHVLAEWSDEPAGTKPNRYIIGFSHHVLYDYSVSRLLMRGPSAQLLRRLQDQDFVLVARPSVGLHFQHLWATNRSEFWKVTFEMLAAGTSPKTVELIGPTVAAQAMGTASDLEPLYDLFESASADKKRGESFLSHLTGAVLTEELPIVGPKAKPWCAVIERLSSHPTQRAAFPLRALALAGIDKLVDILPDQATALGTASRAMLAFSIERLADVPNMVSVWIQVVCRTFATEPDASEAVLRRLLEPSRMKERGFLEIPWLAREIAHVIRVSPAFARDIYVMSFLHQEESTATTRMGTGQLLPLASNRKQDFDSALWSLSEAYPEFLKLGPLEATDALAPIIEDYVRRRHRFGQGELARFEFLGRSLELRTDYSGIWDSGSTYSHDDAVKILDAFEVYVRELSAANDASALEQVLAGLARLNPVAVVWRRLLNVAGGQGGEAIARLLLPLFKTATILTGHDTIVPVGHVLRARSQDFDIRDRETIERVVLSLPTADDGEHGAYLRAKLLGSFPRDALVLEESRTLIDELRAKDQVPSNEPSAGWRVFGGDYGEEDHLQEMGVKLDVQVNRRIADLTKPVRQFNVNPNFRPTVAEVEAFIPVLAELVTFLNSEETTGIEETFRNYTWGYIASACATAVRCGDLDTQGATAQLLKRLLITASANVEPRFDQRQEDQFDSSPGWGTPAARIDAARGVMEFARLRNGASSDLKEAARRLAFDDVAAVRYQVAVRILYFYEADRGFAWALASEMATREANRGVLLGLVGDTLGRLTATSEDEGLKLLCQIFERVPWKTERDEVHRQVVSTVAQLFVYRGNENAAAMVRELVKKSVGDPRPAEDMLFALRMALVYGGDKDRAVRQRALSVYLDLLHVVEPALRALEAEAQAEGRWTEPSQKRAQGLASVVQDLCMQVYFASGAVEPKKRAQGDANDEDDDTTSAQKSGRLYVEADLLITELTRVTLAPAAHKVIETLAFFIPLDPERVFTRIAECVRNSRAAGYQFESLAATLIVTVVERYLADYRYIFRDNERCRRDLIELMDTFVEAGWPSARKLTYKLDEIFR